MILTLMKYEKVLRSRRWLPVGLAMGAFLLALKGTPPPGISVFAPGFRPQYLVFPALFFWAILAPYMLAYRATSRSCAYQMALPIPVRKVWLSHMLALIASALAVLAIAAAVLLAGNGLQGNPLLETDLRSLMVNVAAFTGLAVMLTQIPGRGLSGLPLTRGYIAYIVLVWLGLFFLIPLLSALPAYWAMLPAALATALAAMLYSSLPPTLAMVSRSPVGEPVEEAAAGRADRRSDRVETPSGAVPAEKHTPGRRAVQATIIRSLYNPVLTPIVFVIILVFGLRNSGYNYNGVSNLVWIFWTLVCLSGLFLNGVQKIHLLDPLPISRRTIFAYLVLPGLLFAFLSYGLGAVTGKGAVGASSLVEYEERYYDRQLDVRVPLEFWEISRNGVPAPLEPCCDEPHAAPSVSLLRGTGLVIYNPYHAPADSSPEFVAHQFSRATEAVYGRQIPIQDLLDRYFERRPDGGTGLRAGRFNLLDDFPGLTPVGWGRRLAAVLTVIGVVWLLYLSALIPRGRARIGLGHVMLTILGAAFLFTMIWTTNQGYTDDWKISAGAGILVRRIAETLPGSTPTLWVIALLSIVGCFLLARAQFGRMEIPVRPEQK